MFDQILIMLTSGIYIGSYRLMSSMAKITRAEDGTLLDGGTDLNMNQGLAEYVAHYFFVILIFAE